MICKYPRFNFPYSNPKDTLRRQINWLTARYGEPVAYQSTSTFSGVKIRQYQHMTTGSCHVQECFTPTPDGTIAPRNSGKPIVKNKVGIQLGVTGRYKLVRNGGTGSIFNIGEAVYIRHIKSSVLLPLFVEEVYQQLKVQPASPQYPHLKVE